MIEFENLPIHVNLLSQFDQKNQPDGSSLTGERFDKENISFVVYFSLLKIEYFPKLRANKKYTNKFSINSLSRTIHRKDENITYFCGFVWI